VPAKSDIEIYMAAEFAAIEQIIVRLLAHMAIQAQQQGLDHDKYLSLVLDASSRDMDLVDFWDIPQEQKETVRERAKARLALLITDASARKT
jgi:hypothetical protein